MARLWERMAELYGHRWASQYGEFGGPASETWTQALAPYSKNEIAAGVNRLLHMGEDWPPTLPGFITLCRPEGIPDERQAYLEATRASHNWDRHEWTHPVVYAAAKRVGAWALIHTTGHDMRRAWAYAYAVAVQRFANGEDLDPPPALPADVQGGPQSKAVRDQAMAEIRARLDALEQRSPLDPVVCYDISGEVQVLGSPIELGMDP